MNIATQGAFAPKLAADRARILSEKPATLAQLADRLIVAAEVMRTCPDAVWDAANAEHAVAQQAFRAAVEQATGMSFDLLERAMGES